MEWDTIAWNTVFVFVFLDFNAIRVVRTHFVQGDDVCHNQAEQYQRYSDNVQGEEAVQSNVGNVEVTADPSGQIRADNRDGGEQVNNYLRTPEGHLTPRQQVAHKGFCHQCQENQGTENPHQFTRFFVRTVNQTAEHVQIHNDEEERCAGGVHVADNPAAGHVAHDVLYCGKGSRQMVGIQVAVRFVVHGQENTADDLNYQDEQSQRAEVIPEVEVLRRIVLSQMLIPHFRQGETSVRPV